MHLVKNLFRCHRKACLTGCAVLCCLALGLICTVPKAVSAAVTRRDLPIYCVQKDSKVCSLTFDAAWGSEDTPELISILGKYNIRATFFVVGQWVDKYPEAVRALHEAGHEVMNHSDTHPHFPKLSPEQMRSEIEACNEKVAAITGKTPELFRPPYGDYSDLVVATARDCSMYSIQWDVDSLDWKDPPAEKIAERVLERVQPGSIVLFHNAAKNTPAALPSVIEGLIQKGYTIVPVSELILRENFVLDHTGRQIPAEQ